MGEQLVIAPGSERSYTIDDEGYPTDSLEVRASPEVRGHELEEAERRLRPVVEKGREAEEKLEAFAAAQLREARQPRNFADGDDPAWTPEDEQAFAALRALRGER